jgi:4,5-DOPA dioxygenase extradiol
MSLAPVVFVAHGAPPLLDDAGWVSELTRWADAMPRPRAVLVLSAHWEAHPTELSAVSPTPLVYDFSGFPRRFYEMTYAAPGAPELAARVHALLSSVLVPCAPPPPPGRGRGLDHGAYIPLMCMYPKADIPVLQMSLPSLDARTLFDVGRALSPLRAEGVLVMGSGFLTHNMRTLGMRETPAWASDFDAWCADVLARRDFDALRDYTVKAPGVRESLPTHEHFAPVVVAAGAASVSSGPVSFPITGFWHAIGGASFTRRSVQMG